MQQTLVLIVRTAAILALSHASALAQEDKGIAIAPGELPPTAPAAGVEISASNLMGTPVVSATGASLGQVADVIIDGNTGRVIRLVISKGGIAGFFDDKVAIEASAVRLLPVEGKIVAPGLTPDEIERIANSGGGR
ncbi:PRC-barrel domain-containing protein [Microvirga roseola]|uniref:PRC-barrel domain-containing protein n=1 Tax=Microvirga roseola TaxID=2883126 RepID=UPI001E2DB574|nr:PRC-barrel domain-containing protein [Microvirga roseola]